MKEIKFTLFKDNDENIFKDKLNFDIAEKTKKHSSFDKINKKFLINTPLPNNKFKIENIYLYKKFSKNCLLIHITDDKEFKRRFDHRVFVGKITFKLADIVLDVDRDNIFNHNEIKIIIYNDTKERSVNDLPDISEDFFNLKNTESFILPDDTGGGVIVKHP